MQDKILYQDFHASVQGNYGEVHSRVTEDIFSLWKKNKADLLKELKPSYLAFSEEFTVKESFVSKEVDKMKTEFMHWSKKLLEQYNFEKNIIQSFSMFLSEHITIEDFQKNRLKTSYKLKDAVVPQGMKLSRSFKIFINQSLSVSKEEQERILREIQDQYSTYRQSFASTSSGRIAISGHPLDFLTLSDNNHRWSSCISSFNGAFRVGNLNLMADSVTLVAYLFSDDFDQENRALEGVKWNSKKWRVLVHLKKTEEGWVVLYNQQYPFYSEALLKKVDEMVCSIYNINTESTELISRQHLTEPEFRGVYGVDKHFCGYLDIHTAQDTFLRKNKSNQTREVIIGKPILCLECGQFYADDPFTGQCMHCSSNWECEYCGGDYREDEITIHEPTAAVICYDCYENHFSQCDRCGDYEYNDRIYYLDDLSQNVCYRCLKECESDEYKR